MTGTTIEESATETAPETDGFGGIIKTGEQVDEENQAISLEDAEAAFAGGFEAVHPEIPTEELETSEPVAKGGDSTLESSAPGEEAPAPDPDEEKRELQRKIRRLEGQFGTLNEKLSQQSGSDEKIEATKTEIESLRTEVANLKELEESTKEFGELSPFKDAIEALNNRMDEMAMATPSEAAPDMNSESINDLVDNRVMDVTRPGWREEAATPEFIGFMLHGGPTEGEYRDYLTQMNAGTSEGSNEGVAMLEDWQKQFPDWWQDRGQDSFVGKAPESIKVYDRYVDAKAADDGRRASQKTALEKRQDRLRRTTTPDGVGNIPDTGVTDDEAFVGGFKKASGR